MLTLVRSSMLALIAGSITYVCTRAAGLHSLLINLHRCSLYKSTLVMKVVCMYWCRYLLDPTSYWLQCMILGAPCQLTGRLQSGLCA